MQRLDSQALLLEAGTHCAGCVQACLYVCLLMNAHVQVAKRHLVLPALCSCGHGTSVLDARYPQRCCSNCPLRGNADAYEQLLAGLLSGMGLD